MKTIGFYAGSFDPITRGHLDVIRQALTLFDTVVIGVGRNAAKAGMFTPQERVEMIAEACAQMFPVDRSRIQVTRYEGGMAAAARKASATHMVRAFRQVSDFNDEFAIHGAMDRVAQDLPLVYLICQSKYLHVSSSMARELSRIDEDVDWIVTPGVAARLYRVCSQTRVDANR